MSLMLGCILLCALNSLICSLCSALADLPHPEIDRSWVPCWELGATEEGCCSDPDSDACWDSIYTRNECCTWGYARLYPTAPPEAPDWQAAAHWAAGADATRHPSYSEEQRQWEHGMKNATIALRREELMGTSATFLTFKRSGAEISSILEEMAEDQYRLLHASPTQVDSDGAPVFVVDIGASIGLVSVILAKLWGPKVKIIALEPSPANFRYLLWNLRFNDVTDQVWPLNVAVSSISSRARSFYYSPVYPTWTQPTPEQKLADDLEMKMANGTESMLPLESLVPSAPGGSGLQGEEEQEDESWKGTYISWQVRFDVEAATLPEVLVAVGVPKVHLLKVDCEGCEWAVFSPLLWKRIRHRVRHVASEIHDWALPGYVEESPVAETLAAPILELRSYVHEAVCKFIEVRDNAVCSTM